MVVTCPSCSVRYLVDARALGPSGRTVRCARCGHTWHETPAPDEAVAAPVLTAAAVVAPAVASAPETPPQPAAEARVPPPDPAPALAGERRIQLPAVRRTPRRWGLALAWSLTALAVLAGLLYVGRVERDRIVALVPGAAALYASLGLAPESSGAGLEFRNLATSRETDNGLPALLVSGSVTNVSAVQREVPKLVVSLRDNTGHDLQDVTVAPDKSSLAPGETEPFHARFSQPAEAAVGVKVTFADENPG